MRTKKFLYNSIATALYQVIVMIAGLITPYIILKHYGSEINGLVSSITQFVLYFNLVEAGLSSAGIYALYKPLAEKNYKVVNSIVSAAENFYKQSGYIFMALVVGLAVIYPMHIKVEDLSSLSVGFLVLIIGANGVLEFFTLSKYRILLSADQRIYIISLASLAQILISTIVIITLGSMEVNIVILRFAVTFTIFIRSIILMLYTRRKYTFLDYNEIPNYNALNKRWDALYLQILGVVHKASPVIILTVVTQNLKLVSVYTIFYMVIGAINAILNIFISGLSASFGEVIAKNEEEVLKKAYKEFEFMYYTLITFIYSVAFVTIMPFIRLYTRGIIDVNYDLPLLGFLFVSNGLLYNIKTPQGMLVVSAGLFKETRIQTTIQAMIAVIAGVVLTLYFGIVGVLLGSILSNIYRDIDLLFFIPRRLTKLSVRNTAYRIMRLGFQVMIIGIPFRFIKFEISSYFEWVMLAVGVGGYSIIILSIFTILFERKALQDVGLRINRILKSSTKLKIMNK